MRRTIKILFLIIISYLNLSCNRTIFEYPDDNPIDPTSVNVELKLILNIEAYISSGILSRSGSSDTPIRYITEIYEVENLETPILRDIQLIKSDDEVPTLVANYKLHARKYKILVWTDFVEPGGLADKYYQTQDLKAITYSEPYQGNIEFKSANYANLDIDLTSYIDQWNVVIKKDVELHKPFGKFQIIATDVDKFIAEQLSKSGTKANIEDYKVKVSYLGYLPWGFDVLKGKPNRSIQGVSYYSEIKQISATEGSLTFDYVFDNGEESGVNVLLQIYDPKGVLVQEINNISIPIRRGELTVVKDDFLTEDMSPGIGIDPEFDGEINITIPD